MIYLCEVLKICVCQILLTRFSPLHKPFMYFFLICRPIIYNGFPINTILWIKVHQILLRTLSNLYQINCHKLKEYTYFFRKNTTVGACLSGLNNFLKFSLLVAFTTHAFKESTKSSRTAPRADSYSSVNSTFPPSPIGKWT